MSPVVLLASPDALFAEKITKALDHWGFRHLQRGVDREVQLVGEEVDVALLDIRGLADEAYGQVHATKQQCVGMEVVLINRPDNVVASIAGMKAGAVDEIIVPFDTDALKEIIMVAAARAQEARAKRGKRPLLARFSEAMMAATFAQAGDFAGALDMLDSPALPPAGRPGPSQKK